MQRREFIGMLAAIPLGLTKASEIVKEPIQLVATGSQWVPFPTQKFDLMDPMDAHINALTKGVAKKQAEMFLEAVAV